MNDHDLHVTPQFIFFFRENPIIYNSADATHRSGTYLYYDFYLDTPRTLSYTYIIVAIR